MKRRRRLLCLLPLLGVACEAAPTGSARAQLPAPRAAPPPSALQAPAASRAARALARSCDERGRFVYLRHVEVAGDTSRGRYNVLRHAGALYALDDAYRGLGLPELRAALLRGARYLVREHLRPWEGDPATWVVVSRQEEEVTRPCAKLGGAGLGLVALCAARELDPSVVDLATLRGLGRFVLTCQRPDGSFRSKRFLDGEWSSFDSLYYPGEAILGLLRLAAQDPQDPAWLAAAGRAAAYLVTSRREVPPQRLPHDHWLLIAGAELLPRWPELREPPVTASELRGHLDQLASLFLAAQDRVAAAGRYPGSFERDGAVCPTATRLEGLAAYAALDPAQASPEAPTPERLRAGLTLGASFLRGAQLRAPAELDGTFPRGWLPGRQARGPRGQVRVDFVQHALSALLAERRLAAQSQASSPGNERSE